MAMKLDFGYENGIERVVVPDKNLLGILKPNAIEYTLTGQREVYRALREPIGSLQLCEIVQPGDKIAIITSDITRPMPTREVMPAVLAELYQAGVVPEDITLVFAIGNHRKQTEEERRKLAGEKAYREIRCIDSDPNDCIRLGFTSQGTPVDITRAVAEADRRICLGNIEYHYFAGYSGGAKAIMPGVSTREAIQANHSFMVDASSCAGRLSGNILREDIEEAAAMAGVDFILNVVLDEKKTIVHAVAGDVRDAHRAGCDFLDSLYAVPIETRADIVLVSQGGAPKDMNLYQVQKALDNAKHAVKKGGVVVLIGSCKEGMGEEVFDRWMCEAETAHDLIERIQVDFQLGGHKAAAIAMVLEEADIYLVSRMEPAFVESIFMKPFPTAQAAFDAAMNACGTDATVLAMPFGGSTLPKMR